MGKRRRTVIENLHEEEQTLVSGGEDFQLCLDLFLKDMTMRNLAYHTKRWYKENLRIIERTLKNLKYSTARLHTNEKMLKDVIVYCMEQLGNNPTTINHRIRSINNFMRFYIVNQSYLLPPHSFPPKTKKEEGANKAFYR